jgi:hypothetical protein
MYVSSSARVRHRSDADPDPNFYFDTDPGPKPERHQNDADPHADPTPSFTHIGKPELFQTYIHSSACPHWFILLVNIVD